MESENKQSQTELLHEQKYDVLLNNNADSGQLKVLKALVLDQIRDGKDPLASWRPLHQENVRRQKENVFVDSLASPQFVGKRKQMTKDHYDFKAVLKMPGDEIEKRVIYAMNSVTNEIRISPLVEMIVSDEKLQSEIRRMGYQGLKFIQPLLAMINNETAEKHIFYQYVDGIPLSRDNKNTDHIVQAIRDQLWAGGVMPNDLRETEILCDDKERMLYLVDIEAYLKK